MTGYLEPIVRSDLQPGRYRLAEPVRVRVLRDELRDASWTMRIVDGAAMVDRDAEMVARDAMFDEFAAGCDFPDWFGRNWDAFADCLRDLSWLPGAGVVVLWQHSGAFAAAAAQVWHDAGRVIDTAIAAREAIGIAPLYVLYPADGADVNDGGRSMLRPVR